MNRISKLTLLIVLGLSLAACGSKEQVVKRDDGGSTMAVEDDNMWGTRMSAAELRELGITSNPIDYKTVYFEYNSSAIDRRSEIIAEAHARELDRRGGARVSLEGHADERGTRDYNLALGERRANAVSNLMSATGTGGSKLNTLSYGEERAVDPAHNEAAWQKNRRVEISY